MELGEVMELDDYELDYSDEREPRLPCCDYRDHSGEHPACACPESAHAGDPVHPFAKLSEEGK